MSRRTTGTEPAPAPGTPHPEPAPPAAATPKGELASGEAVSGPAELKIQQAMAFYREALKYGPRLAREIMAEGKRKGHTKRTQERARSRLNVQKIPPTTWQGTWKIALPDDLAVEEAKQRKEGKQRKAQQRQGNGRKRRKRKEAEGSSLHDELLAAAR